MLFISKICTFLETIFKIVSAILLFVMFAVILAQVVMRHCFSTGFQWIDGVSVMGFMWLAMLGSALGVKTNALARVTLVEDKFTSHEPLFFWVQHIGCIFLLIVLCYASILVTQQGGKAIYQMLKIPYSVQYISVTVFCISSILFLIDDILKRSQRRKES